MKMSKKYKALLLAGVLTTLGGNAFADSVTWAELWNDNDKDTIIKNYDITVGLIGRDDGHTSTFEGGSITSVSTGRVFEAWDNSILNFGTSENPLTSFTATKTEDNDWSAGVVNGEKSAVSVYAKKYDVDWSTGSAVADGINVVNGGTLNVDVDEFISKTKGAGIQVMSSDGGKLNSHATIKAKTVDITSTNGAALWAQSNTEKDKAPENASSIQITADTINLTGETGVTAYSNSQVTLNGNTTITGKTAAIDARGNSTTNINTDGKHTTVINGDIVFETPNTPTDSKGSGSKINAYVNLNLAGEGSSWTGAAYQQFGDETHGTGLSGNGDYYGDVKGLSVELNDGATWTMTDSSFVNKAEVKDGASINVTEEVKTFNGDKVDLDGGALNSNGGTTTINTFTAGNGASVSLNNTDLVVNGGKSEIVNFKATGTSNLTLTGDTDMDIQGGTSELSSIETNGTASLGIGGDAEVTAGTVTTIGSSSMTVESGGTLNADLVKIQGKSSFTAESGSTVISTTGYKVIDSGTFTVERNATVSGDVMLTTTDAQNNAKIDGSFDGKLLSSATGTKLDEAKANKILGNNAAAASSSSLKNGTYYVNSKVLEDGSYVIQSTDMSGYSKDGTAKVNTLGSWDKEGNYIAGGDYDGNGNDITNVNNVKANTLEVNKITLGGNDLQETLDAMDTDLDNETEERKAADDWLDQRITKEIADRKGADAAQDKVIQQINNNLVESVNGINNAMATINQNVYDGFVALTEADAKEKAEREEADKVLQQNIEKETAARIESNNTLNTRINQVEKDANKGIAKTAALAALHPLDYDPDNKFDIAAAGGFYKGENAFALGAFYRPNRDIMLSLGTSVSGDDNAYNVGVSFKVGKSGKHNEAGVSTAELYAMIGAMQEKMEQQQKRIEELEASLAK